MALTGHWVRKSPVIIIIPAVQRDASDDGSWSSGILGQNDTRVAKEV